MALRTKSKPEQRRFSEYAAIYDKEATQTEKTMQANELKMQGQQQQIKAQGVNPVQQRNKLAAQGVGSNGLRQNEQR